MKNRRNNRPQLSLIIVLSIVLAALLVMCVVLHMRQNAAQTDPGAAYTTSTTFSTTEDPVPSTEGVQQTTTVPAESNPVDPTQPSEEIIHSNDGFDGTVKTPYGYLTISQDYCDQLRCVESIEADMAIEVFYMVLSDRELEVFRIYYGNKNIGDMVGYLVTDNGTVPVTVSSCSYEADTFADISEMELYQAMMDQLNGLLRQIREDSRFKPNEEAELPDVGKVETKISYWTFSVPDGMTLEESNTGGVYCADFYGDVAGERIKLYSIYLGDVKADSLLGYYTVDGVERPVWVESCDLEPADSWTDEDLSNAYTMLSSINDIIQVIMSSDGFSELPQG